MPTLKIERKIWRKKKNNNNSPVERNPEEHCLFHGYKKDLWGQQLFLGVTYHVKPFSVRNVWNLYYKLLWLILFSILLKHNEERKKKVLRSLHNIEHIEKTHSLTTTKNTRKLTSIISGQEEIRTFNIFCRFFVSKQELRFTKVYFQNINTKVWIWYQW